MKKTLLSLAMLLASAGAWAQDATSGQEVTFTNIQKDGTTFYLYINDDNQLSVSSDENTLQTGAAKFRMTLQSNGKYTFFNTTKNLYMIWRGGSGGYNNNSGVLDTYNPTYCDWTLVNASSSKEGTFYIVSKRNNGTTDGSLIIKKEPMGFDAYGYSVGLLDNFSNLFIINGQEVNFTYAYSYNNETVFSEEKTSTVGMGYPSLNLPVGVTANPKIGTIQAEDNGKTFTFECTNDGTCPVEFASDAFDITKWYYLKVHSNQPKYINQVDNSIEWVDTEFEKESVESHLWGFVGNPFEVKVISKATSTSGIVSESTANSGATTIGSEPTVYFMSKSDVSGDDKFSLRVSGNSYLNGHNGKLLHWNANDAGSAFIPVEYVETDVEVSADNYATLYLDYASYLPTGVKGYIVSEISGGTAKLQEVSGIIPANTGLVLENEGTYTFKKAIGNATDVTGNLLQGTATTQEITPQNGETCYVLAVTEGLPIGFYKAKLTADGKFQNNANKAYLPVSGNEARFLNFDFGTETGIECIESVEATKDAVVYDLAGRRVLNAQKGLYIVNGKVVIK